MHVCVLLQVRSADSDDALREVFEDPDFEILLLNTGYRKPLTSLFLSDKEAIESTLKVHMMTQIKPELDQFRDGLEACRILRSVSRHPSLMAPYFVHTPVVLTKGNNNYHK
jgi:hypothetical protein